MVQTAGTDRLLGNVSTDLSLRIRGTSRNGQVVRLTSQKCTVGSDRRCTLRLQAPGIGPLHCLIIRGENQTIVRRWSSDTRLNGRTFVDSLLVSGDRLGIGGIEFEVLEGAIAPPAARQTHPEKSSVAPATNLKFGFLNEELKAAIRQGRQRTRRAIKYLRDLQGQLKQEKFDNKLVVENATALQTRLAELADQRRGVDRDRAEWAADRRQLEQKLIDKDSQYAQRIDQITLETERLLIAREEYSEERKNLQKELATRQKLLEDALNQLQERSSQLELMRQELQSMQTATSAEINQQSHELQARFAELRHNQTKFEEARSNWTAEQREVSQGLNEQRVRLDRDLASLESEKQNLAEARTNLELQRDALATVSEQNATLARQWEELAERQRQLQQERSAWEQAVTLRDRHVSEELAAAEQQTSELEVRRAALQQEQDAFQSQCARDQDGYRQQQSLIEEQLRYLETQRASFEEEQRSIAAAQAGGDRCLVEREQELAAREHRLQMLQDEILAERAAWQSEKIQGETDLANRAERLVSETLELDERRQQLDRATAQLAERQPGIEQLSLQETEAQAVSADDRFADAQLHDDPFARLRSMSIFKSDESSADVGESEGTSSDQDQTANLSHITDYAADQVPAEATDNDHDIRLSEQSGGKSSIESTVIAAKSEDDEESIDAYMAKLLNRVRGQESGSRSGSGSAASYTRPAQTAAKAAQPEAAKAAVEVAPEKTEFKPLPRRPLPPELTSNLAAMRELGNSHAREAITQHVHTRWIRAAIGKATVAGVGLLASILLLVWAPSANSASFFGSVAAMLIAVFWGLQSAILIREILSVTRKKKIETTSSPAQAAAEIESAVAEGLSAESTAPSA